MDRFIKGCILQAPQPHILIIVCLRKNRSRILMCREWTIFWCGKIRYLSLCMFTELTIICGLLVMFPSKCCKFWTHFWKNCICRKNCKSIKYSWLYPVNYATSHLRWHLIFFLKIHLLYPFKIALHQLFVNLTKLVCNFLLLRLQTNKIVSHFSIIRCNITVKINRFEGGQLNVAMTVWFTHWKMQIL